MQTTRNKVIVRINKKAQTEKREKSGRFYIPDYLMHYRNNLQFGEVVAFGALAKELCPQIEVGCVAIFHHCVEFQVLNRIKEEGNEAEDPIDEYYLFTEPNGDEIRHLTVSDDEGCELFGVILPKVDTIYPSKNIVFCYPKMKQSELQKVKGIYINDTKEKEDIKERLEIINHSLNEYSRVLGNMKLHIGNHIMHENIVKERNRLKAEQVSLTKKLKRITLVELKVAYLPTTENIKNCAPGDTILADSRFLYPLLLHGTEFMLLRHFGLIHGSVVNGIATPINDRVIIKQEMAADKTKSGIIIPETAKEKPFSGTVHSCGEPYEYEMEITPGDQVLFHPKGMVEIFIEDKAYVITHSQNVFAKFTPSLPNQTP